MSGTNAVDNSCFQQGTIPTKDWELMVGAHEFKRTTRRSLEGEKKDKKTTKKAEKEVFVLSCFAQKPVEPSVFK